MALDTFNTLFDDLTNRIGVVDDLGDFGFDTDDGIDPKDIKPFRMTPMRTYKLLEWKFGVYEGLTVAENAGSGPTTQME